MRIYQKEKFFILRLMSAAIILLMAATALEADDMGEGPPVPKKTDKCPVCGMLVYRHPDFLASVELKGGQIAFFDGAKDMFKYLFHLEKYVPGKSVSDVNAIHVTEYYDMQSIPGRKALYVIGSDVYGPMGHELIPFRTMADAQQFMKDHRGKHVVSFDQITPSLLRQLD